MNKQEFKRAKEKVSSKEYTSILERVILITKNLTKTEEIHDYDELPKLPNLERDNDFFDLTERLESEFYIEIPVEDISNMRPPCMMGLDVPYPTIGDLADYVAKKRFNGEYKFPEWIAI